ncbi:TetR/AcrR family transcriptional regulator [Streptomyces sp. NPDC055036]
MSIGIAPGLRRRGPGAREAVLNVALGMRAAGMWERSSMEQIASGADVSRQTLYDLFGSRCGITEALLSRETDRLLDGVNRRWCHARRRGTEPSDCLAAAMGWVLASSRAHPLLRAVLTGHGHDTAGIGLRAPQRASADQQVLRGRLADAVGAVTDLCRRLDADGADGHPDRLRGVEAVVRMTASYLFVPAATTQARGEITQVSRRLLPTGGTHRPSRSARRSS